MYLGKTASQLKHCLLTININNRIYHNYTLNSMKKYAGGVGADLVIDKELTMGNDLRGFNNGGRPNISAYIQKMVSIYDALFKYDRVLFLDDTSFVGDAVENLFDIVPFEKIGGFSEKQANMKSYKHDYKFLLEKKKIKINEYLNAGILIVSKCHQYIFSPENLLKDIELFSKAYPCQAYLNYQITINNIECYCLEKRLNYQPPFIYPNRSITTLPLQIKNQITSNKNYIYHITGYYQHRNIIVKEIAQCLTNVTVVIMNYHRPNNIRNIIIPALLEFEQIDEIIISHCNKDTFFEIYSDKKEIIHRKDFINNDEHGLYCRYIAALETSKNECLFIMDDDLIVDRDTFNSLYQFWLEKSDIIHGIFGRNKKYAHTNIYGNVPIVLTRCLFTHIDNLRYLEQYRKDVTPLVENTIPKWNGEDIFLSLLTVHKTNKLNITHQLPVINLANENSICKTFKEHFSHRKYLTKKLIYTYNIPVYY